ncbi:MAG TPA: protein translocase subunit SecF, partial [Armatimonadota bacterium]
ATILDGKAQISGGFQSAEEAQRLTDLLNAGALPVPLKVIQQTTVEATIGKVAVAKSMDAGAVGLGLVILFMACYYLLPGLLADIALAIYALLSLAVFKLAHVTLTLPGIAAFILSIGMAVDANILIFERLKEELRGGKTLHAAVDAGFSRAFTSIFDSNMCTLITCAVLSYLGTGAIQGFAYVLALGVVISMFTAITTTRTLLHMVVNTKLGEVAWLYGLGRQWVAGQQGRSLNIVGRMAIWFGLSAAVIIPGMIFWGTNGLKKGIDFTGGGFLQVSFQQPTTTEAISGALDNIGLTKSTVQKGERNEYFIRTKEIDPEKAPEVRNALKSIGGEVQSEEHVGGIVSKELTNNAVHSVLLASLLIVFYLSIRFAIGGFAQGFRFGMCAILATLHDIGVMIGIFAILGYFLNWEIDSLFITALLTVIGFSTHDTIVIFDRIRENLRHRIKGEDFEALVNRSINQSFARSINTSFTVVLTLVGLLLFGAHSTRQFIVALLVGVVTGTYSSIFNASQMLVLWQRVTGRDVSGRSVVPAGATKARDLKPLVDVSLKTPGAEEVQETTEEAVAEAKAKAAKKRKKRY